MSRGRPAVDATGAIARDAVRTRRRRPDRSSPTSTTPSPGCSRSCGEMDRPDQRRRRPSYGVATVELCRSLFGPRDGPAPAEDERSTRRPSLVASKRPSAVRASRPDLRTMTGSALSRRPRRDALLLATLGSTLSSEVAPAPPPPDPDGRRSSGGDLTGLEGDGSPASRERTVWSREAIDRSTNRRPGRGPADPAFSRRDRSGHGRCDRLQAVRRSGKVRATLAGDGAPRSACPSRVGWSSRSPGSLRDGSDDGQGGRPMTRAARSTRRGRPPARLPERQSSAQSDPGRRYRGDLITSPSARRRRYRRSASEGVRSIGSAVRPSRRSGARRRRSTTSDHTSSTDRRVDAVRSQTRRTPHG